MPGTQYALANFCSFLKAAFLPEPECDEGQNCDDRKTQSTEFRRWVGYSARVTTQGVILHEHITASTVEKPNLHLGPIH